MNINDKWSHYALVKKACLVLKFGVTGLPQAQPANRLPVGQSRKIQAQFLQPGGVETTCGIDTSATCGHHAWQPVESHPRQPVEIPQAAGYAK